MTWLTEPFAAPFMRRALLEVLVAGAVCGVVGVHVILRRLSFFAMAMGHSTFPGLVLASLLGVHPLAGAALFGLVVVVTVAFVRSGRVDETSAIGVVLAGSFALGVLLLSTQHAFSRDVTAFLVGSVITVQRGDLVATAATASLVLFFLLAFHKELVLGAFDRPGLIALGYPATALDVVALGIIEMALITSIPALGTILSVALLVTPAATARLWAGTVGGSMLVAGVVGAGCGAAGLILSYHLRVAAGGAIVLVASAVFGLSLLVPRRYPLA